LIVCLVDFRYVFQTTHDGVVFAGVFAAVIALVRQNRGLKDRWANAWLWGGVGGLAALSSPTIAMAWIALSAYQLLTAENLRRRHVAVGGLIALLVVAPWMVRNAIVFHRFVPIKSNAGYELYQSLFDEPSGVLTMKAMQSHPVGSFRMHGLRYRELGEIKFVAEKRSQAMVAIRREPMIYLADVTRRLAACTVNLPHVIDMMRDSWFHRLSQVLHLLTFVGFVVLTIDRSRSDRRLLTCCVIGYVSYLLPYVLLSFYARYLTPLLLIRVLFTAYALRWLFERLVGMAGNFSMLKR